MAVSTMEDAGLKDVDVGLEDVGVGTYDAITDKDNIDTNVLGVL